MEKKKLEVIDLFKIYKRIKERKRLFYKTFAIVFVVSCALILCVPRTYKSEVLLAPEMEDLSGGGALSSIASSFGFDLGSIQSTDAISPMLYPELFESTNFIVSLLNIEVETEDGSVKTDYFTYLLKHQKKTLYKIPFQWTIRKIKGLFSEKKKGRGSDDSIDPFMLSEDQNSIVEAVKKNITCSVDKKTIVISITVTDQDRLICATLADSVRQRLQNFITEYRTNKARNDLEYYTKLTEDARIEYEASVYLYSEFVDANRDMILQSYISKRDELENDMQLKFNTYSAMLTQLDAARAKVQERTPAFTVLQGATVPIKPAGPKRMLFVLGMLILSFLCMVVYIMKDDIKRTFTSKE